MSISINSHGIQYVGLHHLKNYSKYMSISDLFDSGFKKRNQDHFAAIVRVAMERRCY